MSSMSSMSRLQRLQRLKMFVSQRLTAAVDDILRHLDTTMTEYEEELQRRHQAMLDERQHTDVQQLLLRKEEVQQCCPHVDQEDPKAPHIKKEEEELWSCQGGGQFQGPEASDIMFLSSPVSAKSEDDEEKPPASSWTEHVGTEVGVEDSGGPGPARTTDPDPYLLPVSDDKVSNSSEAETELSDDDKERGGAQPGRSVVTDNKCPTAKKSFMCCECGRKFGRKDSLRRHMRFHTGEKPYSCSICSKRFSQRPNLIRHMRCHSGEKPFGCSFCDASFAVRSALVNHMRIHTGEKPFGCLYCVKSFAQKGGLKKHMTVHTGEKPYSCPACDKSFSQKANLTYHFSVHTGQKQFSCSACKKRFTWQSQVKSHKCVGGNSSN